MTNRISRRVYYTVIIYIERVIFTTNLFINLIMYFEKTTTLSPVEPPLVPHRSYLLATQHFLLFKSAAERQNHPYSFLTSKRAKTYFFLAMNAF